MVSLTVSIIVMSLAVSITVVTQSPHVRQSPIMVSLTVSITVVSLAVSISVVTQSPHVRQSP